MILLALLNLMAGIFNYSLYADTGDVFYLVIGVLNTCAMTYCLSVPE